MITIRQKGDFAKTTKFLEIASRTNIKSILEKYGGLGVQALSNATPIDSGLTARSWGYRVEQTSSSSKLIFYNTNVNKGVPIAIILQYGHGTGTGGWVQGRDYINPAIQPIFDQLAEEAWKEVTKL